VSQHHPTIQKKMPKSGLLTLIKKDLNIELRTKENSLVFFSISLIFSAVLASGLQLSSIAPETVEKLAPAFVWTLCLLTAAVTLGNFSRYEYEEEAMSAVLLSSIEPASLYLSKVFSLFCIVFPLHLTATGFLSILINFNYFSKFPLFILFSTLTLLGFACLVVIFQSIISVERITSTFLPVFILPFLFPLFFSSIELSIELYTLNNFTFSSFWLTFLICTDLLYFVFGINVYGHIIRR
jgi:ABC-type transport system involved in cytochrome c biogenesis permease component